jgi:hypothetical protein
MAPTAIRSSNLCANGRIRQLAACIMGSTRRCPNCVRRSSRPHASLPQPESRFTWRRSWSLASWQVRSPWLRLLVCQRLPERDSQFRLEARGLLAPSCGPDSVGLWNGEAEERQAGGRAPPARYYAGRKGVGEGGKGVRVGQSIGRHLWRHSLPREQSPEVIDSRPLFVPTANPSRNQLT